MPDTNAGNLTNNLLRRLRDPDAVGLSHEFIRRMLSDSQRLVNAESRRMKETATLTTYPFQQFYKIQENLPAAIRIENVRVGGRDLRKTTLKELCNISTKWHRQIGDSFKHFALIGRDLLVIYPARDIESSVDVVYTKLTTALDSDIVEIEMTDDDMVQATDLAQLILLTKMREFVLLEPLLAQYMDRSKLMQDESK